MAVHTLVCVCTWLLPGGDHLCSLQPSSEVHLAANSRLGGKEEEGGKEEGGGREGEGGRRREEGGGREGTCDKETETTE